MFPAARPDIRTRYSTLPGGLRLRLAEAGEPSAPPVLLLHGWGASLYMWRDWFAPLAAAGWRPIAVDLPGHGLSDKPADDAVYRLDGQLAAIRALLDVERLEQVEVVAQSMAGTIALELALRGEPRVRRLALVNPACFGRVRLLRLARAVTPPAVDLVLPHLVSRQIVARTHRLVYGDPSRLTERDVDEYWAPSQFPGFAPAMRRLLHHFSWTRVPAASMSARLSRLASSSLVVLGGRDRLVCSAGPYVAELLRLGAPLVAREIAAGGHAVNEERPEEVIPLVLRFFAGSAGGDPVDGQHRAT
jgi:pimeloyl-ACP methyl ester carboxylesterase